MKKIFLLISQIALIFSLLITFLVKSIDVAETASFSSLSVFIDPGHGGKDNGANYDDVVEDEINLHIASFLLEELINHHHLAFLTRTGDYDLASLYAKNRKNEDLNKRCQYINTSGANIFVSIHLNKYDSENVKGCMVYYKNNCEQSKTLGICIQKSLNQLSRQEKKVHTEDLYLFSHTDIPGVLVECGFISNTEERKKLLTNTYQKLLAKNIFKGIENFSK